jgi:phosphatidylethanolamine-binding protein (PEBP) family uncharacterized protein
MTSLLNVEPVHDKLYSDWAVAGLKPTLTGLPAGHLPASAIIGINGTGKPGYHLCPPNHSENYLLKLYALPHPLHLKPGFEPIAIRKQALNDAFYAGQLIFNYKRH